MAEQRGTGRKGRHSIRELEARSTSPGDVIKVGDSEAQVVGKAYGWVGDAKMLRLMRPKEPAGYVIVTSSLKGSDYETTFWPCDEEGRRKGTAMAWATVQNVSQTEAVYRLVESVEGAGSVAAVTGRKR